MIFESRAFKSTVNVVVCSIFFCLLYNVNYLPSGSSFPSGSQLWEANESNTEQHSTKNRPYSKKPQLLKGLENKYGYGVHFKTDLIASLCCLLEHFPGAFDLNKQTKYCLKRWSRFINGLKEYKFGDVMSSTGVFVTNFEEKELVDMSKNSKYYKELEYDPDLFQKSYSVKFLEAILTELTHQKLHYKRYMYCFDENKYMFKDFGANFIKVRNSEVNMISDIVGWFGDCINEEGLLETEGELYLENYSPYLFIRNWSIKGVPFVYEEFISIGEETYELVAVLREKHDLSTDTLIKAEEHGFISICREGVLKINIHDYEENDGHTTTRFFLYKKNIKENKNKILPTLKV